MITLKSIGIDNLGITFIEPPACDCCNDNKGECARFIFKDDNEVVYAAHKIINSISSDKCMGLIFKLDGDVFIADKQLETTKYTNIEDAGPKIPFLVQALNIDYMLILAEIDYGVYEVLYQTSKH